MSSGRILVIGGGSIGTRHTRNLLVRAVGDVMVVDPDNTRREALADELHVRTGANADSALTAFKPDIVFVCSPTALHVPQAIKAVDIGAHVFIEKPLSHSMEGVEELCRKAREKKRVVMVGCNMRFHPGLKELKHLLDAGAIGASTAARIVYSGYLPNWRPQQDYRQSYSASVEQGGAVLDCIHEIDLALWEFGPAAVIASKVLPATKIGLITDGEAEITLRHTGGVESHIHLSFMDKQFQRSQHIMGTAGSLSWDFTRGVVERRGKDGSLVEIIRQPAEWESNQMYMEELNHFLNAIETKSTPMGSLDAALAALQIALTVRGT